MCFLRSKGVTLQDQDTSEDTRNKLQIKSRISCWKDEKILYTQCSITLQPAHKENANVGRSLKMTKENCNGDGTGHWA